MRLSRRIGYQNFARLKGGTITCTKHWTLRTYILHLFTAGVAMDRWIRFLCVVIRVRGNRNYRVSPQAHWVTWAVNEDVLMGPKVGLCGSTTINHSILLRYLLRTIIKNSVNNGSPFHHCVKGLAIVLRYVIPWPEKGFNECISSINIGIEEYLHYSCSKNNVFIVCIPPKVNPSLWYPVCVKCLKFIIVGLNRL